MSAVATSPQYLAEQVRAATEAMRTFLKDHASGAWNPRELMSSIPGDYGTTVRSMAFWALVKNDEIVVDDDFTARAA